MKVHSTFRQRGFTLLETVIAIGVLAVLLSGFMVVFTPAAEGIRKSINVQQADRLATTLEQELVTLRGTEVGKFKTGFNKSYDWIKNSGQATSALMIYQYRGELGGTPRADGTPAPVVALTNKVAGKDYVVIPMVRLKSDTLFNQDLKAVEGAVYLVKCTQLIFAGGELKLGTPGAIKDPKGTSASTSGDDYPEAVIAFSADFHMMPAKTEAYFASSGFTTRFTNLKNPVFSRNLAVRR